MTSAQNCNAMKNKFKIGQKVKLVVPWSPTYSGFWFGLCDMAVVGDVDEGRTLNEARENFKQRLLFMIQGRSGEVSSFHSSCPPEFAPSPSTEIIYDIDLDGLEFPAPVPESFLEAAKV